MIRSLAMASGIVLAAGLGAVVWAAPGSGQPRPCPNICVPNVRGWGHFPTTWRQWPGERLPERTNPRSIGSEVLPAPKGEKQAPRLGPPEAPPTTPLEEMPLPPDGMTLPLERLPAPPGEIPLPPGGLLLPPERLPAPAPPGAVNPAGPLGEGGVSGLPVEPNWRALFPPPGNRQQRAAISSSQHSQLKAASPRDYHATMIAEIPDSPTGRAVLAAYVTPEPTAQPEFPDAADTALPALNGYCAVELGGNGRWAPGDPRWTVVHKGQTYRFSGPAQRQRFLADPDAFAPVNSGNDPVLAAEENRVVAGRTAYCATYKGRLYLFSSAATQARFGGNPQRYAAAN